LPDKKEASMKRCFPIWRVLAVLVVSVNIAGAHCEIPCGIYGDEMRLDMIAEHITTVERSIQMIAELSKDTEKNFHQLARWVVNKEEHANYIQDIVSQYFLTQRINISEPKDRGAHDKYVKQLVLLHEMLVYAMRAKQSTDLAHVVRLRGLLEEFKAAYLSHKH
jgi:nickel superoxide dismutase